MLVHGKKCSNPNIIDEQLQLVVLFVPPHGDQFNYFLFEPSPPSQEGGGVFFFQFFVCNTLNVLDFNFNFWIYSIWYTMFLAIGV